MKRLMELIRSLSHGLSLLEVADQLGTSRIIRVVAPFRERATAVKRVILLGIVTIWCIAWTHGHQPVLVAESKAVMPIAITEFGLSVGWLVWMRLRRLDDTLTIDLAGSVANFLGLAVLLEYAPILLISLAAIYPLMCIAIGAKYGRLAFYVSLGCTVLIVALIPPSGYWASRPAYAVYALTLAVGVPLAVSRVLTALREISLQAVESRNAQKRFLSTMAHELRTPLNTLLNAASLVEERTLSPANRKLFETILANAGALSNRVQDTLDIAAVDERRLVLIAESFNLTTVLDVVTAVTEPAAIGKSVSLSIAKDPLPEVALSGDSRRIEQVLTNLVGNAIKFTPAGGRVELLCSAVVTKEGIVECTFSVVDNGPGVPDSSKIKIFEPFYQVPQAQNSFVAGAGLGLSIAASISETMGGRLSVADSPSGGANFIWTFALPVAATAPHRTQSSAIDVIAWHRQNVEPLRILVVDDSQPNREMAATILGAAGHHVEVERDGLSGLSAVETRRFDLVLLDVHMPGLTGWQVLSSIAQTTQLPTTPKIVILTALNDWESVETAKRLGAATFLSKPLYPQALLDCVRQFSHSKNYAPDVLHDVSGSDVESALEVMRSLSSADDVRNFLTASRNGLLHLRTALASAWDVRDVNRTMEVLHSLKNEFATLADANGTAACVEAARCLSKENAEPPIEPLLKAIANALARIDAEPEFA